MKYIDIHSHISLHDYQTDLEKVIQNMKDAGVATIVIGVDLESSQEAVVLAEKHENIFACIGAHPRDTEGFIFEENDFAELVKNPKVVAIGECGLDYFKFNGNLEVEKIRQKNEFIKQIEFAAKYSKPLMMHIRDAHDDAYEILQKYQGKVKGNLHFFTESSLIASKFIDLGFTVSFPGVITFAKETEEAVKNIPLEMMHAETDSPYAAPVPYRGKRNEPTYVIEVVKKIAEIRGEDIEKVRIQLLENTKRVFGLKF
jgi:TatD DNase family protein